MVEKVSDENIDMKDEESKPAVATPVKVKVINEVLAEEYKNKGNDAFKANNFK